jgi:hypothetical protein
MKQSAVIIEGDTIQKGSWCIQLVLYKTRKEMEDTIPIDQHTKALFAACNRNLHDIGSMHVCAESNEFLSDIIHEVVHAVLRLTSRMDMDAPDPEELFCQHFEHILPQVLDFYGFEIKRKEIPE